LIKSPADGYTLGMVAASTMAINPVLFRNLTFVPSQELTHVAPVGVAPNVLLASAKTGAKDLDELVAFIKAKPDAMNFGSGGVGNTAHLQGLIFNKALNVKLQHISYKSEGDALTALAR